MEYVKKRSDIHIYRSYLLQAIDDKQFDKNITNKFDATIWYYLAWSGNYQALLQAIEDKQFDKNITNKDDTTIWHYLEDSKNYNALLQAIDDKHCDINIFNIVIRKKISEHKHKNIKLTKIYQNIYEDDCVICHDRLFGTSNGLRILKCGHVYHEDCFEKLTECCFCRIVL